MDNFVITIARGFGSGGKRIASALAKELGVPCYENRILSLASQLSGLDEELFEEVNEKMRGKKFSGLLRGIPRTIMMKPVHKEFISDDQLFEFQRQIINNLAHSESCIIVGKCADWILKDYDNVISIYVEAPRAFCIENVMDKMGVNKETASNSIEKTDLYRAEYYKHYTKGNYWTNPVNYDITINSQRVSFDNAVQLLKTYITLRFPDVKSLITNAGERDE